MFKEEIERVKKLKDDSMKEVDNLGDYSKWKDKVKKEFGHLIGVK